MRLEKLGYRHAVLIVPLHTQLKGLESTLKQIDAVRLVDGSHDATQITNGRHGVAVLRNDDAGKQVIVPTKIFGGGVQDKVDTILDRLQLYGVARVASISVSTLYLRPSSANCSRVDATEMWIGWRLADQHASILIDRPRHRLVVTGLNLPRYDSKSR